MSSRLKLAPMPRRHRERLEKPRTRLARKLEKSKLSYKRKQTEPTVVKPKQHSSNSQKQTRKKSRHRPLSNSLSSKKPLTKLKHS